MNTNDTPENAEQMVEEIRKKCLDHSISGTPDTYRCIAALLAVIDIRANEKAELEKQNAIARMGDFRDIETLEEQVAELERKLENSQYDIGVYQRRIEKLLQNIDELNQAYIDENI
jgi:hypothetical protein